MNNDYLEYKRKMHAISDMSGISSLLQWDQEIFLPAKAGELRARQMSLISGMIHEQLTNPNLLVIIDRALQNATTDTIQSRNLNTSRKDILRKNKLNRTHVERSALIISHSYEAWENARKENNFDLFAPHLEKIIELKRSEADMIGFEEHPYDALLDEYEPGMKTSNLERIFRQLRTGLNALLNTFPLVQKDDRFMYHYFPKEGQWELGLDVLREMGYDFERGRQDLSTHPFTITFNANDVRVTTRIDENNFHEMLWSCIHEGGHALYEQGLSAEHSGIPQSEAASLSIHESQSRLWENHVGRGMSFWTGYYPKLQTRFPSQLKHVNVNQFYAAINRVEPSLIRTNADELTYHMHVIIRFELEKQLIDGSLKVRDLREQWNEMYKKYLGIEVPDDMRGVLQDVHWSHGSFGYFPTYTLGSLYAAQFFNQAQKDIPEIEKHISTGNLAPLLSWLRKHVHAQGRLYTSEELCEQITGEKLNDTYFLKYAQTKYTALYL